MKIEDPMFLRVWREYNRPAERGGCKCEECTRAALRALWREVWWWVFGLPGEQIKQRRKP